MSAQVDLESSARVPAKGKERYNITFIAYTVIPLVLHHSLLRVDYISGGLYQLKMCKRAGTVHISCSGSYLIVPFIHVFRVPLV